MPSTAIRDLSYDEVTSTLFVTFADGDLYAYLQVPTAVYRGFRAARSKGGYFAREVRDRYAYRRMPPPGGEADPIPGSPSGGPVSPPPAASRR